MSGERVALRILDSIWHPRGREIARFTAETTGSYAENSGTFSVDGVKWRKKCLGEVAKQQCTMLYGKYQLKVSSSFLGCFALKFDDGDILDYTYVVSPYCNNIVSEQRFYNLSSEERCITRVTVNNHNPVTLILRENMFGSDLSRAP